MELKIARPLTKSAFAPYGDVIEFDGTDFFHINDGLCERYHNIGKVDIKDESSPYISLVRSKPIKLPVTIDMLERHPFASQAFIPIHQRKFLVAVAKGGDEIQEENIELFVTNGQQGVNYHAGIWHFPILALDDITDMLIVDRAGPDNCDVIKLSRPFKLSL
ncbi:ureidoglycolate lyase [Thorsellia kenyensis]|uniref:Ureidoglycolate lyase n=1 Tax=Thorsellia kenyensis TaxID=1549888 RepID=A0ABV6C7L6_9GAMM